MVRFRITKYLVNNKKNAINLDVIHIVHFLGYTSFNQKIYKTCIFWFDKVQCYKYL